MHGYLWVDLYLGTPFNKLEGWQIMYMTLGCCGWIELQMVIVLILIFFV